LRDQKNYGESIEMPVDKFGEGAGITRTDEISVVATPYAPSGKLRSRNNSPV